MPHKFRCSGCESVAFRARGKDQKSGACCEAVASGLYDHSPRLVVAHEANDLPGSKQRAAGGVDFYDCMSYAAVPKVVEKLLYIVAVYLLEYEIALGFLCAHLADRIRTHFVWRGLLEVKTWSSVTAQTVSELTYDFGFRALTLRRRCGGLALELWAISPYQPPGEEHGEKKEDEGEGLFHRLPPMLVVG